MVNIMSMSLQFLKIGIFYVKNEDFRFHLKKKIRITMGHRFLHVNHLQFIRPHHLTSFFYLFGSFRHVSLWFLLKTQNITFRSTALQCQHSAGQAKGLLFGGRTNILTIPQQLMINMHD